MKRWFPFLLFLVVFAFVSLEVAKATVYTNQADQKVVWVDNDVGVIPALSVFDIANAQIQVNNQVNTPILYIWLAPAENTLTDYRYINFLYYSNYSNMEKILRQTWSIKRCIRALTDFK
jgi:hypothetical protein